MARALTLPSLFGSESAHRARALIRRAAAVATPSAFARIEPLEERRLMSTTLVSVNFAGTGPGNGPSGESSVSSNGRFVVFSSSASNLVATDTNGHQDVFIRDLQTNTTTLVSVNTSGVAGNNDSFEPKVSDDGRYVVFRSLATDLVANDNSTVSQVFIRDLQTQTTRLVSATPNNGFGDGFSGEPVISASGRFVTFTSFSNDLVVGDSNAHNDIFMRDTVANTTTLISQSTAGVIGNNTSYDSSMSSDGRYVAFRSDATNLVGNTDTNGNTDVFLRDTQLHTTTLISVTPSGTAGNKASISPSVSSTGRYVLFRSKASDLTPLDNNNADDVFIRDTQSNTTTLLSINQARTSSANGTSVQPSISQDGHFAAFSSTATNLVGSDGNGATSDIFVRDLFAGPMTLLSTGVGGAAANGPSNNPNVSANGGFVVFDSTASNLTANDNTTVQNVYIATTPSVVGDTTPPTASVDATQTPPVTGAATYTFTVTLADNVGLNTVSVGNLNVLTPSGATLAATPVGVLGSGTSAVVTYQITAPNGVLSPSDNGTYTVTTPAGAIKDAAGNAIAAGTSIGTFALTVCPPNCPDLVPAFISALPAAVISGKSGTAKLRITNINTVGMTAVGTIKVNLYLSDNQTFTANDTLVGSKNVKLKLKINHATSVKIKYAYPTAIGNGNFYLIAVVDPTNVIKEINKLNNSVTSSTFVQIAAPFVDLSGSATLPTGHLTASGKAVEVLTLTNNGNSTLNNVVPITVVASPDNVLDASDPIIASFAKKVKIAAGRSARVKISFTFPSTIGTGAKFLIANIDPSNTLNDPDTTNNIVVSSATFTLT